MDANKVIEIEGIKLNGAAIDELWYLQESGEYPRKFISEALEIIREYWENDGFRGKTEDLLAIIFGLIGIENILETLSVRKEVRNETV